MFAYIILLVLSIFSPLISATAAGQFKLSVDEHASPTISAVHNTYDDPLGNNEAIGNNCKDEPYITTIPSCLVSVCVSAPDVAYAMEFGKRWCGKAGVDVSKTLVLPETYQLAAKEYFQSEAHVNAAGSGISRPALSVLAGGAIIAVALAIAL